MLTFLDHLPTSSSLVVEDGGVDITVKESRVHKMDWMPDFPPLLASSVFDL